jgi:hypothetical protein
MAWKYRIESGKVNSNSGSLDVYVSLWNDADTVPVHVFRYNVSYTDPAQATIANLEAYLATKANDVLAFRAKLEALDTVVGTVRSLTV